MIATDILVESGTWPEEDKLTALVDQAVGVLVDETAITLPKGAEAAFVFTDDAGVQKLNLEWRDRDAPTNVLSFASNDGIAQQDWSPLLGDVVLAFETLAREAREQEKTFDDHLIHMIVHGVLHLLGYDHGDDRQAEAMEALEVQILARLHIADPYRPV